ncbi:MAG: PTS glucose transporter subunit IIA [Breznakia sp.]
MLNIFKKKVVHVYAPVSGKAIDICDVKDEVFSKKMMGDGIAIETVGDVVCAPIDAKITMLFPSMHAIGLVDANGFEMLIHIGIDTVKEEGDGFVGLVQVDDKVKQGDRLIQFDLKRLQEKGYDMTSIVVFTNCNTYSSITKNTGKVVEIDDVVATYTK